MVCPFERLHLVAAADVRVGGTYRIEMHHNGGKVHVVVGIYLEIEAPRRLVYTWRWEGNAGAPDSLVTVDFHRKGAGTEIVITHDLLPDEEDRARHSHGWFGCLDRLSARLDA